MRYHAYDEAPDYLRGEVAAQRRYERSLLDHPDCRDPDHPGCKRCDPETHPEGYVTAEEWAESEIKLIRQFAAEQDDDRSCAAGWTERFHDFVNDLSRGMK